ncbi:MAG: ATP-binding protein [Prolixibacteraceae bacterium]|jgi:predicted AAA+ superfamily ATPase|nr:ATP-binding protein [Prolixibacteraceae bacterium]
MYLNRPIYEQQIVESIKNNPVTAILGPRQCGKTTLARRIASDFSSVFIDLEDPADFELLRNSPKQFLEQQSGLVVIDEIQVLPELFNLLRVLADQASGSDRKFLILGSASPDLIRNSSESLAGRIGFVNLTGFNLEETGSNTFHELWLKGGFPRSYLAPTMKQSFQWREDFIRTFLERDISMLGFNISPHTMRKFWMMMAHYHGQIWKASEFSRSLGISEPTAKRYLDILSGTYMVRQLQPWYENLKKRQVKSPKVYIRDSGILHALLSLPDNQIMTHVKLGASWEGFVIEQIMQKMDSRDYFYWRTHTGVELDLLILKNSKRYGFEIKYSEKPQVTQSMRLAMEDLKLDKLFLVYQGKHQFEIENGIKLLPAQMLGNINLLID